MNEVEGEWVGVGGLIGVGGWGRGINMEKNQDSFAFQKFEYNKERQTGKKKYGMATLLYLVIYICEISNVLHVIP